MNRVLLKLYWMTVKASFRALGRKFLTVRGAILSLVTLGFAMLIFVQLIITLLTRSRVQFLSSDRFHIIVNMLPLGLLFYFLAAITPSLGERALQFSPSEIDFLFPAPFTRRQLLAYYLLRGLVAKLALAVFVAVSISFLVPSLLCAIVGIFLSLVFLHGATVAAQLVQQAIGTQIYTRARRIFLMIVVVALGIGIARTFTTGAVTWTRLIDLRENTTMRLITAPFDFYSRVIVAPQLIPNALLDLAVSLVINVAVYALIFRLDTRYEDMAVRSSQRMYERLQAMRSGNIYVTSGRTEYAFSLVPSFPWWTGVGPNLRRQLMGGLRDMRGLLWLGMIVAVASAGVIVFVLRQNPKVSGYIGYGLLGITAYVTFILSGQLPLGFRGDLNYMEVLKVLPVRPIAIATAEVVSASIIACLGQWFLVVVGVLGAPSQFLILLSGAAFFFPYNLLLFGINNLLLLIFPFRLASSGPDITLLGRVLIMMAGNVFAVALAVSLTATPAVAVFLITNSWTATLIVAWIGLLIFGIGLLFAVAWAFRRFDVSTDMPDS